MGLAARWGFGTEPGERMVLWGACLLQGFRVVFRLWGWDGSGPLLQAPELQMI